MKRLRYLSDFTVEALFSRLFYYYVCYEIHVPHRAADLRG